MPDYAVDEILETLEKMPRDSVRPMLVVLAAEVKRLREGAEKARADRYERQRLRDALIDLLSVLGGGDTLEVVESHPGQWQAAVAQACELVENTNDEAMHSTNCAGGCGARLMRVVPDVRKLAALAPPPAPAEVSG